MANSLNSTRMFQRFRRSGLFFKAMIANSLVVTLCTLFGTYFGSLPAGQHTIARAFFISAFCAVVTIGFNYLAFWEHFRPLMELSRALDAIRKGQEARKAIAGVHASGLSFMLSSVRALLERIDDESLHFSARLLGSVEAERRRIGRELHDEISQILAAALLKVGMIERDLPTEGSPSRNSLSSVRDLIERALEQLKVVVYDLRPAMLDDLGLVAALRWYVKARADKPGLEVVTRFDVQGGRLPGPVETALYRIAQEALANAVSYSKATRIELGLEIKPGYAALKVFDNGCGFDLAQARGRGLGLPSMRERVALLGGKFNLVTETGAGTRVYAVIPLPDGPDGQEMEDNYP